MRKENEILKKELQDKNISNRIEILEEKTFIIKFDLIEEGYNEHEGDYSVIEFKNIEEISAKEIFKIIFKLIYGRIISCQDALIETKSKIYDLYFHKLGIHEYDYSEININDDFIFEVFTFLKQKNIYLKKTIQLT